MAELKFFKSPYFGKLFLVVGNENPTVFTTKPFLSTALIFVTALASCAWFDRNDHQKIIGDYEVGWNDLASNRNITKPVQNCTGCYEAIVEEYVFAVGHNDSFIIAKTHLGFDKTTTHFDIVDVRKNEKYGGKTGLYGPLNESTFDSLRRKLNISNIVFDMNYPEMP